MKLVKVNRVSTTAEARELERLGAGLIGVSLVADTRFRDRREVGVQQAIEIAGVLERASVVAHLAPDIDAEACGPALRAAGIRRIEYAVHPPAVRAVYERFRQYGLAIGHCRIVASHDDDPSWILGSAEAPDPRPIAHREVELLPEMDDAWRFLRDSSPAYEDELQIEDIERLAAGDSLFISVGATRDSVVEIVSRLPSITGLSFNLGVSNPQNAIAHASDIEIVRQVLAALAPLGQS
jgi:hypothetical protein